MKKILSLILAISLLFAMTACGGGMTKEEAINKDFSYIGNIATSVWNVNEANKVDKSDISPQEKEKKYNDILDNFYASTPADKEEEVPEELLPYYQEICKLASSAEPYCRNLRIKAVYQYDKSVAPSAKDNQEMIDIDKKSYEQSYKELKKIRKEFLLNFLSEEELKEHNKDVVETLTKREDGYKKSEFDVAEFCN